MRCDVRDDRTTRPETVGRGVGWNVIEDVGEDRPLDAFEPGLGNLEQSCLAAALRHPAMAISA